MVLVLAGPLDRSNCLNILASSYSIPSTSSFHAHSLAHYLHAQAHRLVSDMAATAVHSSIPSLTPLGEVLNAERHKNNPNASPSSTENIASPPLLRRIKSLRVVHRRPDSSDSLPSPTGSIYNAEAVLSTEDLTNRPRPDENWPFPSTQPKVLSPNGSQLSVSPLLLAENSSLNQTGPHSRWPTAQLATIVERDHLHTARAAASHSRLRSSPERKSRVVKPQQSIHSIYPQRTDSTYIERKEIPWPLERASSTPSLYKQRSFSCNDIDDLRLPPPAKPEITIHSPQSSSSTAILEAVSRGPVFPAQPVQPPPERAPTPPGLASFGSLEAQRYRLELPHRPSRWRHLLGISRDEADIERWPVVSPQSGSRPGSPDPNSMSPPMDLLKRILGVSKYHHDASGPSETAPRASLPPGVTTSSKAGYLTQASDGTFMRGSFRNRASAHGTARALDAHPLQRQADFNSIDEEVRQIEKACAEADLRNAQAGRPRSPRFPQTHPLTPAISPQSWASRHRVYADSERTRRAREMEMARAGLTPLPVTQGAISPAPRRAGHAMSPVSTVTDLSFGTLMFPARPRTEVPRLQSPVSSTRMEEPPQYAPRQDQTEGEVRSRSSIAAFQEYVEQEERRRARAAIENNQERQQDGWCKTCFQTCCGIKKPQRQEAQEAVVTASAAA